MSGFIQAPTVVHYSCASNEQKKKNPRENKTRRLLKKDLGGLGLHFGKGYIVHFVDALLVNEPGVEGGQVEDEAFLKLFSKDKKKK